jgi:F0F1-type ATP synthase assembly protein I
VQPYWKGYGTYGSVGLELAVSVLLGLFGGRWLDGKLGTDPWLTWLGLGLGIITGYRAVWRALKTANREARRADERDRNARKKFTDEDRDRKN